MGRVNTLAPLTLKGDFQENGEPAVIGHDVKEEAAK